LHQAAASCSFRGGGILATSLIPPMLYERLHNACCAEYLMASEINDDREDEINDDREEKTRERRHVASQGISRVRARLPSSGGRSDREEESPDAPRYGSALDASGRSTRKNNHRDRQRGIAHSERPSIDCFHRGGKP